MFEQSAAQRDFGIKVFGSSMMRVEPDIASIHFSVSRLKKHPKDSFHEVRGAAQQIQNYLAQAGMTEVGSSRVSLKQIFQGIDQQFVGYQAEVSFRVLLRDLNRMEEILSGVVDAGVNRIGAVSFETSRLKEIRAEARRRAVAAAHEKAMIYCDAAGVQLGAVLYIEDVNPDMLRYFGATTSHASQETPPEDKELLQAFSPGSIVVNGAVRIAYQIHP